MQFLPCSHAGTLSKCKNEVWEKTKTSMHREGLMFLDGFLLLSSWKSASQMGSLHACSQHLALLLSVLFSLISVQCGQQGNLSLSHSDTDANILYMRVLILDRPVPRPALSVLFLTSLAVEWDMSFAWATPGAPLRSHAPSLDMSRSERQVMSALFLHRGYISVNPFSYQYSTGHICFITLRQVTGGAVFRPAALHRCEICLLVWNFLPCGEILHNRRAELSQCSEWPFQHYALHGTGNGSSLAVSPCGNWV